MVVGTHAENATVLFTDGMKDNQNRTWACVRGAAILQQGSTLLAFSGKKYFLFLQLHARLFQEGGQPIYIARNMHVLQSTSSNDLSTLYYPVSLFLFLFFPFYFFPSPPCPTLFSNLLPGGGTSCSDGHIGFRILLRTSADDGETWTNATAVAGDDHTVGGYIAPIVDQKMGKVILLYNRRFVETWQTSSTDKVRALGGALNSSLRCTEGHPPLTKKNLPSVCSVFESFFNRYTSGGI